MIGMIFCITNHIKTQNYWRDLRKNTLKLSPVIAHRRQSTPQIGQQQRTQSWRFRPVRRCLRQKFDVFLDLILGHGVSVGRHTDAHQRQQQQQQQHSTCRRRDHCQAKRTQFHGRGENLHGFTLYAHIRSLPTAEHNWRDTRGAGDSLGVRRSVGAVLFGVADVPAFVRARAFALNATSNRTSHSTQLVYARVCLPAHKACYRIGSVLGRVEVEGEEPECAVFMRRDRE